MTATASTSSSSRRRGRPGWTRYQWPRSIASVIDPRNAAPTSVRSTDNATSPSASTAAASSPTRADDDRDEVEPRVELRGGRLAPRRTSARRSRRLGPIDARHRRDPCRPPVVLRHAARALRRTAARRRPPARRGRRRRWPPPTTSRTGVRVGEQPGGERTEGDHGVHAAQQPAIPEPDLAAPGGEPAERHPADRPLQQHGGGLEADHAAEGTVASRRRAA